MERYFMLHPGLKGHIRPYWELLREKSSGETDPLVARIQNGEIEEAGIIVAFPPLPYAWTGGRFFALFPTGENNQFDWKEVTKQIEHDPKRGLEECPEWLRVEYAAIAGILPDHETAEK